MKTLKRNQRDFEYIPFIDAGSDIDENGDHTGDYDEPHYGNPIPYKGNISVPSGQAVNMFYGREIRYTHVLVMDKPEEEFNEQGIIRWQGKLYEIKAVMESINSFSAALRQMSPGEITIPDPEPQTEEDPADQDGEGE